MNEFEKAVLGREKELVQKQKQQAEDLQVAAAKIEVLYRVLQPIMKKYNVPVIWTPGTGMLSIKIGNSDNYCSVEYVKEHGRRSQVYRLHSNVDGFSCSDDELWGDVNQMLRTLGKMVADLRITKRKWWHNLR